MYGVNANDAPLFFDRSTLLHSRAVVTGAAGNLDTFCTPTPPSVVSKDGSGRNYPKAVIISAEVGTGACYVTVDGITTPTATLGLLVPTAPALFRIPVPGGLGPTADFCVKAFSATTANLQVYWEF